MSDDKKIFSLYQVTKSIQRTLSERYQSAFWVKAEMNKLNFYKHSGHCYPELVDKENGKVVALVNATLWKEDFHKANNAFLKLLGEPLKDGIKILFLAKITFDPAHGLSLRIVEIDPSFTLGDLEREKQETIKRLYDEGVYRKNKQLTLPLLPQRIAIISVETSKGFADFINVIDGNPWKYKFFHMLFPSLLQGEKAVDGILLQLDQIRKVLSHFDVVAIIRGGGGDVGLSCYNSYKLAKEIADFPLPVITGIGHATNETVAEMISHLNAITPTKLADYLIQRFHEFAVPVARHEEQIITKAKQLLSDRNVQLQSEVKWFRSSTEKMVTQNRSGIRFLTESLQRQSQFRFGNERNTLIQSSGQIQKEIPRLLAEKHLKVEQEATSLQKSSMTMFNQHQINIKNIETNVRIMSPENVLKRGYSITTKNGKSLTSSDEIEFGDVLTTKLYNGEIISVVQTNKL